MRIDRYSGELVRLCPVDKEKDAALYAAWNRNSEFMRLSDLGPSTMYPVSMMKTFLESEKDNGYNYMIETLEDSKRIGSVGLWNINWTNRCAFVGIGIGEPDYWGKGYGTEAMLLILKFGFADLNLHRIQLGVYEYNKRAIRSYEKCGFKVEGAERELVCKEDRRWDSFNMGILQSEWQAMQE